MYLKQFAHPLEQESANYKPMGLIKPIKKTFILSQPLSCKDCLCWFLATITELSLAHKAENISFLPLYRKSLPAPGLELSKGLLMLSVVFDR